MLENLKELLGFLNNTGVNVVLDGLFDPQTNPVSYSKDEHKAMLASSNRMPPFIFHEYETRLHSRYRKDITTYDKRFYPDIHNYFGMYCSAGKNTLRLGPDGIVLPCFGVMQRNQYWDLNKRRLCDIPELNKPIICPANRCHCGIFIKTPKWRSMGDAPQYMRSWTI